MSVGVWQDAWARFQRWHLSWSEIWGLEAIFFYSPVLEKSGKWAKKKKKVLHSSFSLSRVIKVSAPPKILQLTILLFLSIHPSFPYFFPPSSRSSWGVSTVRCPLAQRIINTTTPSPWCTSGQETPIVRTCTDLPWQRVPSVPRTGDWKNLFWRHKQEDKHAYKLTATEWTRGRRLKNSVSCPDRRGLNTSPSLPLCFFSPACLLFIYWKWQKCPFNMF